MASGPHRQRHAGNIDGSICKGIEQFGVAAMEVADRRGEAVIIRRPRVECGRRVIVVVLVIDGVVPGIAAGSAPKAPALENAQFRGQVEAVGNEPGREAAVAVIGIGIGDQRRIGALQPHARAIAQGVVPADGGRSRHYRVPRQGPVRLARPATLRRPSQQAPPHLDICAGSRWPAPHPLPLGQVAITSLCIA